MLKTNHIKLFFGAGISLFAIMVFALPVHATTFLQDDFTGTTIDTSKWTEVDSQTGGTVGDVQQNGTLTVRNSNTPFHWK